MNRVIILNSETIGHGDPELGKTLMGVMLRKLWAKEKKPDAIICYNSAVKLIAGGSDVLDALSGLSEAGVEILACGTCIDKYRLNSSVKVGRVSGMDEILSLILEAESVITV